MKKLDYEDFDKCIVCLGNEANSFEHVLPRSIGGRLQVSMLCKKCNSNLGTELVSQFQEDPTIRLAIKNLKDVIPDIHEQYEEGKYYFGTDEDNNTFKMEYKDNNIKIKATKMKDESIIYDSEDALYHLKNIMKKNNVPEKKIERKLKLVNNLDNNEALNLTQNLSVVKKPLKKVSPDLRGDIIDKRLIVLIAYEYMGLLVGTEVYRNFFDKIRKYILGQKIATEEFEVEYLRYKEYKPFHKMYSGIQEDHIKIYILLFGKLLYKVKFYEITAGTNEFVYVEDLENKKSFLAKSVEEAQNGVYYEL